MNYNKYQFSKVNDKKVLHKIKKQWVVISLAILMALGGGAAVGYTAHADATTPTVQNTGVNFKGQASKKTTSQNITDRAKALHSDILRDSSSQNKQVSNQSNNTRQNNFQDERLSNNFKGLLGNSNLLTQGNIKVYVHRLFIDGHTDRHQVNLSSDDSAVTDERTSIPKGDGYRGDTYTYTLPNNWQSLDRSRINYNDYLKGFSASSSNHNKLCGTFIDSVNQGNLAALSNNHLTLTYIQQPYLDLTINYYYNNQIMHVIHQKRYLKDQNGNPTEVDMPSVFTDSSGDYRYNGEYKINNGGTIKYKNNFPFTIFYIMDDNESNPIINIYLTRVSTIYIKYVNSRTHSVVDVQTAGCEPDGTPFDYQKCEYGENHLNPLPVGYQLDNDAEDEWNLDPVHYPYYTNSDQTDVIYIKPLPASASVINVNYIDSKTGKVIYDQNAGHKPDGTPFDYKKFEGLETFNYLPKGYQLDNKARDGWNLNPVHYPYYTNRSQTDYVYVDKLPVPVVHSHNITIEYLDTDYHDKIISTKPTSSKPDGSSFNIEPYKNNIPKNYQLDNSANDSWNLDPVHYPYYTNSHQIDFIYVKHQTVPVSRQVTNALTVNYRYQNGDSIPGVLSKTEQITYAQSGIKDKVTGQTSYSGSWNVINGGWPLISSPNLQGYEPDKAVINEVPSYNSGNKTETVVYHKVSARPYNTTSSVNRSVTNTLTVNYRDQDGHPIPGIPSKTEQVTYTQSGIKDQVTGQTSYFGSWNVTNGGWPSILSPNLQGYEPDKSVINDVPSYNSGNKMETVIYHKIPVYNKPVRPRDKTSSVNRSVTYTLTINYRDQNGNLIPGVASKSQSVSYIEYGTKDDKTGVISWHNDWTKHRNGGWSPVLSPDLTNFGYGKPSRQIVDDVTPDYGGSNKIENVYYSKNIQHHSQVPSTPIIPVPKPNNPATPNPVPKPSITPEVPKIPSQPKNTPQLPASKPNHDHTVIHPNNGVTPTSKHVKLRKLIKRYKHHRHSYQKWIPRLIDDHKRNVRYPGHYKINKRIIHHFGTVTYHPNNDYQSSRSKFGLPQTNESNGYRKAWSIVLMSLAMIITAFGLAINITKHHVK